MGNNIEINDYSRLSTRVGRLTVSTAWIIMPLRDKLWIRPELPERQRLQNFSSHHPHSAINIRRYGRFRKTAPVPVDVGSL